MMLRVFLLAALTLLFSIQELQTAPIFDEEAFLDFTKDAARFQRRLLGCPLAGYPPVLVCQPGAATFDVREWEKLRNKAKDVFK